MRERGVGSFHTPVWKACTQVKSTSSIDTHVILTQHDNLKAIRTLKPTFITEDLAAEGEIRCIIDTGAPVSFVPLNGKEIRK